MSDFQLTTPVAFIIFNRPDTTEQVFSEIAKAKPTKLLVVGDGARSNRLGESEKVAAARDIINRVDWECEVLTNFSEVNLGCKIRVSSGLDWIFQQVEEAIILEDDCLPDPSFFRFCQDLLQRYKYDQRIGMISGDNFQFGHCRSADSYYFSKYVHIWGWATWRDRWTGSYDVKMEKWPHIRNEDLLIDMVGNKREASFWKKIFENVYCGKIDTWDYQWVFANWLQGRMSILPAVNMISNVGFNANATHTTGDSDLADLSRHAVAFPLKHPVIFFKNREADQFSEITCFRVPLFKRIKNKISGLFK